VWGGGWGVEKSFVFVLFLFGVFGLFCVMGGWLFWRKQQPPPKEVEVVICVSLSMKGGERGVISWVVFKYKNRD